MPGSLTRVSKYICICTHVHVHTAAHTICVCVYLATVVSLISFYLILYNYNRKWGSTEGRWQLAEAHNEIEHIVLILK